MDETNNRPLLIIGPDEYDLADLDRDEFNEVRALFVAGLDATTGYPVIECFPTPADTNETIRIRYQLGVSTWTSANDSTKMHILGFPQIVEPALMYGATKLYLEDKGDDSGAVREATELAKTVKLMKQQNLRMQGNRRARPRHGSNQDGSLIYLDSSLASHA